MREKSTNHKHQFEISVLLRSTSFLSHRAAAPSHHVPQMMLASEAADILFFVCLVDHLPIKNALGSFGSHVPCSGTSLLPEASFPFYSECACSDAVHLLGANQIPCLLSMHSERVCVFKV